ncbi:MAG: NADH-quinone oxidoreductase subunit N [Pirellulales bacterium]|nr:NADH-quinone oxidoreductase subunit N [Pirellulales bacterium]
MTDSHTISLLLPEIIVIASATLLYIAGAFVPLRSAANWLAALAIGAAALALCSQGDRLGMYAEVAPAATSSGPLAVDLFGYTARWGILGVGLLLVMLTTRSHDFEQSAEEAASILMMLAGLMLASAASELILLFAGLELVSIPTYIVLYIDRHNARGQEAASKYFFLSILSSAILLYGFSCLYGVGGSTRLAEIAAALNGPIANGNAGGQFSAWLVPLAMLMIFAGLAFRLAAVPFHFYAPDVYQGTSNANAALLSTVPKIAGLVVLSRIAITGFPGWESLAWKACLVLSVLTMTVGNILALWQTNLRRLLAYSSIAHAGYLLIGVSVALAMRSPEFHTAGNAAADAFNGLGAAVFYLLVYMAATVGAFASLVYLSSGTDNDGTPKQIDTLDDIAGLNRSQPVISLLLAAFMFSLAGIPPLAGFWGKFALLFGALTIEEAPQTGGISLRGWFVALAVIAVLNAAIAATYYLRVIGALYFRSATTSAAVGQRKLGPAFCILVCAILVFGIGLFPKSVVQSTNRAGRSMSQANAQPLAELHRP